MIIWGVKRIFAENEQSVLGMEKVKVSVIIPVYNTAAYLREAVGSITGQTLKEIEILIVDDGSTDGSGDIIRELAGQDERITVFTQENKGQSVARNVGLDHAIGEFVYFMDSDDLLDSNALALCYNYCWQKQLDFVFFDGDILYEDNQTPLSWNYHRTGYYDESVVYQGVSLVNDMLEHAIYRAVPWLWLVSRKYLEQIHLRFYPGIIHEDELFSVLLFVQSERIGCLKSSLVKHRVRRNSTMTKRYSLWNVDCYLTVIDQLFCYADCHLEVLPLIERYASYTLNAVFQTAFVLPLGDKCRVYMRCIHSGYLKYIDKSIQIKFWVKR